jgi:DNA-binding response OmpR family regulator
MVGRGEFDVVVLDVKMPFLDGIQVFLHIRETMPDLPVVLLTGHGSIDDAFRTSKNGVADYLSKPVDIDELSARLHEVAGKAKHRPERTGERTTPVDSAEMIRVMLVDDEMDFLESLKKVFERRNMDVITACSGYDALELLKKSLVDVVVLDVKMPGMDGLEVLRRIKKDFAGVQVVLLSGHPSVEAAVQGVNLGASEYIKKPPEIEALAATIRELYRNRQEAILERQKKLIEEIRRRYPE